jgi:hypothetical protein
MAAGVTSDSRVFAKTGRSRPTALRFWRCVAGCPERGFRSNLQKPICPLAKGQIPGGEDSWQLSVVSGIQALTQEAFGFLFVRGGGRFLCDLAVTFRYRTHQNVELGRRKMAPLFLRGLPLMAIDSSIHKELLPPLFEF